MYTLYNLFNEIVQKKLEKLPDKYTTSSVMLDFESDIENY